MLKALIPFIFVFLWSTGFIGARYGLPYAEPATLLAVRTGLNILVFFGIALFLNKVWPKPRDAFHSMVTGVLIHGCYLGGVFAAIALNMPAGITALIVGLQPVLTALLMLFFYSERMSFRQWCGLICGFAGVTLVLLGKMDQPGLVEFSAFIFAVLALLGISLGTLYQKRYCQNVDLITGSIWQYVAALLIFSPLALMYETGNIIWNLPFILTMTWLVLGLSVVAMLLLMYMIRQGSAARVAAWFYLVPPLTAIEAWFLFGETMALSGMLGVVLVAVGVSLIMKKTSGIPEE